MILLPRQYNKYVIPSSPPPAFLPCLRACISDATTDIMSDSCYYDNFNNYRCRNNRGTWNSWARWLVLGLIVFGVVFVFFLFS